MRRHAGFTALIAFMSYGLGVLTALPERAEPVRVGGDHRSPPAAQPRPAYHAVPGPQAPSGPSEVMAPAREAQPPFASAAQIPSAATPVGIDPAALRILPGTPWPRFDPWLVDLPVDRPNDEVLAELYLRVGSALYESSQPRAGFVWYQSALLVRPTREIVQELGNRDAPRTLAWLSGETARDPVDPALARCYLQLLDWQRPGPLDARAAVLLRRQLSIAPRESWLLALLVDLDPGAVLEHVERHELDDPSVRDWYRVSALKAGGRPGEALKLVRAACDRGESGWLRELCELSPAEGGAKLLAHRTTAPADWEALEVQLELLREEGRIEQALQLVRHELAVTRDPQRVEDLVARVGRWASDDEQPPAVREVLGQGLDRLQGLEPFHPEAEHWDDIELEDLDPERFVRLGLPIRHRYLRQRVAGVLVELGPNAVIGWMPTLPADHGLWIALLEHLDGNDRTDLTASALERAIELFPDDAELAERRAEYLQQR